MWDVIFIVSFVKVFWIGHRVKLEIISMLIGSLDHADKLF